MANSIKTVEQIRIHNMVDMGLRFSGMMRLYKKGSKQKMISTIENMLPDISNVDTAGGFEELHSSFCQWAKVNISSSGKIKDGERISYGQAAKTFDVTISVLVYYCGWPNKAKSMMLMKWLHAAVDNDMMRFLKRCYRSDLKDWPTSIKHVNKRTYGKLQNLVKRFIKEKDDEIKLPVQFDDKYWYLIKEGYIS